MRKQGKHILMTVLGLILAAVGLALAKTGFAADGALEALPFVLLGIGCGAFGNGLGNVVSAKAMDADPELARQAEIDARDERNTALAEKAKARAYDAMIYTFGAVLLAFALMRVDMRAILLLVCAYLFVAGYGVYCRIRLEKVM